MGFYQQALREERMQENEKMHEKPTVPKHGMFTPPLGQVTDLPPSPYRKFFWAYFGLGFTCGIIFTGTLYAVLVAWLQ